MKTSFFEYHLNTSINNQTFNYSIFSFSETDLGVWTVICQAFLVDYPWITMRSDFKVNITAAPNIQLIPYDCLGSSDVASCKMFVESNPPYFLDYPDS